MSVFGNLLAPILAHHHNQAISAQRAAVAKGMGLDPAPYGVPYPGSTNTSNTTTTNQNARGWFLGPLLGVLLAAAGGAGTYALTRPTVGASGQASPGVPASPVVVTPSMPAPSAAPREFDYVREDEANGEPWKETSRIRCRQMPSGEIQRKGADGTWAPTTWEELGK